MSICTSIRDLINPRLREILDHRTDIQEKPDGSYVSAADLLIQKIVIDFLSDRHPQYRIISEELPPPEGPADPTASYVVMDPLDGTENFVSGLHEWGVGISVYEAGRHRESLILLPELGQSLVSGQPASRFRSRIQGLSSSLRREDLLALPEGLEYRIMGCSMYNLFNVIRGSYAVFENVKGVNAWDILPGLNLALEHGCQTYVDGEPYRGELLWPDRKYRVKILNR